MECDYEYEARCQKRFKKLISTDPGLAENFNVPDIIDELSGKTVITSEWVPGVHIDKVSFHTRLHHYVRGACVGCPCRDTKVSFLLPGCQVCLTCTRTQTDMLLRSR